MSYNYYSDFPEVFVREKVFGADMFETILTTFIPAFRNLVIDWEKLILEMWSNLENSLDIRKLISFNTDAFKIE